MTANYVAVQDLPTQECPVAHWRVWEITLLSVADVLATDFGEAAFTVNGSDCGDIPKSRTFFEDHADLSYYLLNEIFPVE